MISNTLLCFCQFRGMALSKGSLYDVQPLENGKTGAKTPSEVRADGSQQRWEY